MDIEEVIRQGDLQARAHLHDGRKLRLSQWLEIAIAREWVVIEAKANSGFDPEDQAELYVNDERFKYSLKNLYMGYPSLAALPQTYESSLDWIAENANRFPGKLLEDHASIGFENPQMMKSWLIEGMR